MADIDDYIKIEKSQIDLDSNEVQGDLGLADYILEFVPYDTIVLSMEDMEDGLKQSGVFYMAAKADVKAWRIGRIVMIGPSVKNFKVNDMVIFPGVKGLESGEIYIKNHLNVTERIKNGHFLSEDRIFGRVLKVKE